MESAQARRLAWPAPARVQHARPSTGPQGRKHRAGLRRQADSRQSRARGVQFSRSPYTPITKRSRRALLTAAAGDDGSIIHVCDTYTDVQSTTSLANVTNNSAVLFALNNQAGVAISAL